MSPSSENSSGVLALIPARGGSKGVPRKNIRPLGGKPLLAWSIEAAKAAPSVSKIIVSTEDEEIAEVAKKYGAEVPFMRPANLAEDATPDYPVCLHVLDALAAQGVYPEFVAWLRPTAPLRTADDIEKALAILKATGADSVRSVVASKAHPYWMKTLDGDFLAPFVPGKDENTYTRRQALPPVYMLNGAIDITRSAVVRASGKIWGEKLAAYVMPQERSVDIDTLHDFETAEARMKQRP